MSYQVVEKNNKKCIYEKTTQLHIYTNENRIYETVRKLNLGSGFKGFTPAFFANSVPLAEL